MGFNNVMHRGLKNTELCKSEDNQTSTGVSVRLTTGSPTTQSPSSIEVSEYQAKDHGSLCGDREENPATDFFDQLS